MSRLRLLAVCRQCRALAGLQLLVVVFGCGSGSEDEGDRCLPDDQDGVIGGTNTVLLSVSDTGFAVGGPNSGSTQRNITIQNSSQVTLTLTNTGTRPHSFVVECIPSGLPAGCEQTSCLPAEANIPPIDPATSMTAIFTVPAVEGPYPFSSDAPGDQADDGSPLLVGQFVLN